MPHNFTPEFLAYNLEILEALGVIPPVNEELVLQAGETINGGKAVALQSDGFIYAFDITNPDHFKSYVGTISSAVSVGDSVTVTTLGKFYNPGANYIPGHTYFIGVDSFPTTTWPTSGWCKQIGIGIDSDNLLLNNHTEYELI